MDITIKALQQFTNLEGEYLGLEDTVLASSLLYVRHKKYIRNRLRQRYYEQKINAKTLGISIPRNIERLCEVTSGWGSKTVDVVAKRSRFDGFVYKDVKDDPLKSVLDDNMFHDLYKQTVVSELIHSCSFMTVTAGGIGEPPVVINSYSAQQVGAKWNSRKKQIDSAVVVTGVAPSVTSYGFVMPEWCKSVTSFMVFTSDYILEVDIPSKTFKRTRNTLDRPLIEPFRNNPSLHRPFGVSRISRNVMGIIDRALRCILRTDVASEFYTAPQKYILGLDIEVAKNMDKWNAYIGNILGITNNEEGDKPTVGQFPQMSFTPFIDQLRSLASEFAGETGIPVSSLGVIHDNPSSAEAIYASTEDLIIECEDLNTTNGYSLRNVGKMALALLNGNSSVNDIAEEYQDITPKFVDPSRPSIVSQSDAIVKQASAIPYLGETTVALEKLGYTENEILRMQADKVRANGQTTFSQIAQTLELNGGLSFTDGNQDNNNQNDNQGNNTND